MTVHVRHQGDFRWEGVDLLPYKEVGTHFAAISRQILLAADENRPLEVRYFEIAAGGHSTFERHEHRHDVVVLRGRGEAVVGEQHLFLDTFDVVHVPTRTWHQFRASAGAPLGFLCLVPGQRDRPERPSPAEAELIRAHPVLGPFVRL